jgi:hypothetical protein
MSIHVLHRPGFRVDVLRLAVRVGELAMGIRQKDADGFRVTVHHRFFARTILDVSMQHELCIVDPTRSPKGSSVMGRSRLI